MGGDYRHLARENDITGRMERAGRPVKLSRSLLRVIGVFGTIFLGISP